MPGKTKVKGKAKCTNKKKGKKSDSKKKSTPKIKEEYARVLDYLPHGHPDDSRPIYQKKPLVQAVGENKFVLMELSPKRDKVPVVYERVYIGEGEREVIDHVIKRLKYKELTQTAQKELLYVVEEMVKEDEKRFIQIFNNPKGILEKSGGIRTRGNLLAAILNERRKGEFSDFEDLMQRVKGFRHPKKRIAKMIEDIIKEDKQKRLEDIITRFYRKF